MVVRVVAAGQSGHARRGRPRTEAPETHQLGVIGMPVVARNRQTHEAPRDLGRDGKALSVLAVLQGRLQHLLEAGASGRGDLDGDVLGAGPVLVDLGRVELEGGRGGRARQLDHEDVVRDASPLRRPATGRGVVEDVDGRPAGVVGWRRHRQGALAEREQVDLLRGGDSRAEHER